MLTVKTPSSRLTTTLFTLVMIAAFGLSVRAQEARNVALNSWQVPGVPEDWSTHHVVFSDPGTEQDAIKNGTHDRWLKVANDPRFVLQQLHRSTRWLPPGGGFNPWGPSEGNKEQGSGLHRDWAATLGTFGHGTAGLYPAKYGASGSSASCTSDFVAFPTAVGSNGVASIIAYNNLYSGCSTGTVPTQFWAANLTISSLGTHYSAITTSPVVSIDGTEVAFTANINGAGYFVVLLVPSGDVSTVTSLTCNTTTNVNAAPYAPGAAPQAYCFQLSGGSTDTGSSPYYDYTTNTMYVGDDNDVMHTIADVFHTYGITGTLTNTTHPTEGTTVKVLTAGTNNLTSPVYDYQSGLIFVGDSGGYAYSINSSGTVIQSGRLSYATNGISDSPIVDSTTENVYFTSPEYETAPCATTHCSAVIQLPATFAANATGTAAQVGMLSNTVPLYDGSFDNTFYSNPGTTGYFYTCGNAGGDPTLYRIAMATTPFGGTSGTGAVTAEATLTTAAATCSPVTEVDTSANGDEIFLSVTANGVTTVGTNKCTGTTPACLYSYTVTSGAAVIADGFAVSSGTSGIVIDTVATGGTSGSEQIYYEGLETFTTCNTTTGLGGCAVQVSQSALQ